MGSAGLCALASTLLREPRRRARPRACSLGFRWQGADGRASRRARSRHAHVPSDGDAPMGALAAAVLARGMLTWLQMAMHALERACAHAHRRPARPRVCWRGFRWRGADESARRRRPRPRVCTRGFRSRGADGWFGCARHRRARPRACACVASDGEALLRTRAAAVLARGCAKCRRARARHRHAVSPARAWPLPIFRSVVTSSFHLT